MEGSTQQEGSVRTIRVLLLDADAEFRDRVRSERWAGFAVWTTDCAGESVKAIVGAVAPDCIVFEADAPRTAAWPPLVTAIRFAVRPPVLVAMSRSPRALAEAMRAGVRHFFDKIQPLDVLERQLRRLCHEERAHDGSVERKAIQMAASGAAGKLTLHGAAALFEAAMIERAMELTNRNRSGAARMLGVTPQALRQRERRQA